MRVRLISCVALLSLTLPVAAAPRTSSLKTPRSGHAATLMPSGKLLFTGGENRGAAVGGSETLDLSSGVISPGPALLTPRVEHTATLLRDGRVLVAGGRLNGIQLDSTELLEHGTFVPGPRLAAPRVGHTATLLADGRVLLAGGDVEGTLEVVDPAGDRVTAAGRMTAARSGHSALLLADGRVLLAGGQSRNNKDLSSAELFDPRSGVSTALPPMGAARVRPLLRQLGDGKVQVMGGDAEITMEMLNVGELRFTAQAHLLLGSSTVSKLLASPARGVLFHRMSGSALKALGSVGPLLDRDSYTLTDAAAFNLAVVAGGVSGGGMIGVRVNAQTATSTLDGVTSMDACSASVTTDKTDYQPGDTVTITGTGFEPGESVGLVLTVDPLTHEDVTWTVTADDSGSFTDSSYVVQALDADVTFLLTATGTTSGCVAQTTFTDSVTSVTITAPTGGSPVTLSSLPSVVNVTFSYVTSATGTSTADIDILPGPVASLSAQPITAGSGSATIGITIPTGTASGNYNVKVTVHNSTGTGSNQKNDQQNGAVVVNACSAPTIVTCAGDQTASANASCQAAVPDVTAGTTTSGGCGTVTKTQSPLAGSSVGLGPHTVTITATDSNGNHVSCNATFTVNDTTPPVITRTGSSSVTVECHSSYTDAGATASDNCGGNLTASIVTTGSVDANIVGTYTIHYNVSDAAGNPATEVTRTVNVSDSIAPTITLNGDDPLVVECHTTYTEPGATAHDACAGDFAATPSGTVNPNTVGTYTVTYNATDPSGNHATPVTRTVNVVDTTKPVITLSGADPMTVECHTTFTDPGATANDSCAGSLPVTPSGTVDANTVGSYTITYTATDPSGNSQTKTRTVNVRDTTVPTITLNGANPLVVECHTTYIDPGATAHDTCAGDFAATPSGTVDPNTVGSYTVTYNAADPSGNSAIAVTRTVNVVDTTAPTISLIGANPLVVECHTTYTDPGATAHDACAGDFAATPSGTVNPNTVGTYTVTYKATDPSGNHAVDVTRTVNVVDTTKPVITINGTNPATVECHTSYTDAGATANDSCAGAVAVTPSSTVNVNVPGVYSVTYTASDPSSNTQTATRTVNVVDTTPPSLTCPAPATALAGTGCQAPVPDMRVMATDLCAGSFLSSQSPAPGTMVGLGATTVTLTATDPSGNTASCQTSFTVTNDAPVITSVTDPTSLIAAGASTTVTASFTDAAQGHTCVFSWDDGGPDTTVTAGATSCSATHTYAAAGVYSVSVTVTDDCGASDADVFQYVVVYDPNAGFVTGGGTINSLPGSYLADTSLTGKASFGFVSKYQKGAKVPTGETEFQFQVASFNFHSTAYEWLVVSGAKAQYKGTGTVNNAGNYGFLLTATDGQLTGGGGVDKFRIKIWDNNNGGAIVYDNVYGSSDDIDLANPEAISTGSIVIHSSKN